MKKKKILMIVSLPPPVHGSNVVNNYIINNKVINRRYEIDVINYSFVNRVEEIGGIGLRKLLLMFYYILLIIKKILFHRPDLVYFPIVPYGVSFLRDALVVFVVKLFRIRLVYHLHGKGAVLYYKKLKWIYNHVYKNVSVICLAEKLTSDIPFYKGTPFILNNGIENLNIPKKINHHDIPNILYLSNFIESKGILVLLEALAIVAKDLPNSFTVTLIGAYSKQITKTFLENNIKEKKLNKYVNLLGPKYREDKISYFQNADIFVFPTYNDCFPLVLLEASQFSLPLVSTYEGGIPSIIRDGVTGFLTKQKDARDLADKLKLLIRDKELRIKMGAAAKKRFEERYTLEKFEDSFCNIIDQIIYK